MGKDKIVVIVGTNASGKSTLGIQLAEKYNGAIISADSRQVFTGFDLCCGKVNALERQIVPHYMLDICKIGDDFSVSDYQHQVYKIIPGILAEHRVPFVVGGTGLYINAIVKGYSFQEADYRDDYRNELESKTIQELQRMLPIEETQHLQSNISDYNNKRRLIRILEKIAHGEPLIHENNPQYDALQLGVTWPKDILGKRIEERLSKRIEQGMIDEVREYLEAGNNPDNLIKLGLEYRYITWYVQGKYASFDEFYFNMATAIKRFAKKQMTWFKKDPSIHWIDMTGDYYSEACDLIDSFLY